MWGELSYGLEAAKPAAAHFPSAACCLQPPQQQRVCSLVLSPALVGSESLCCALQSPLVPQAETPAERPGLGYQGWLLPPSMLLRSSPLGFVGERGGPAEICKNESDANIPCQRAYGVGREARDAEGRSDPPHEKNNALGHDLFCSKVPWGTELSWILYKWHLFASAAGNTGAGWWNSPLREDANQIYEIELQWFSHAAYCDQTASPQGMNHATGSVPHGKTGLLEQGGRELPALLLSHWNSLSSTCVWNSGIYLVFPGDVFRGLNLHHPYPLMLTRQTLPGRASPGHAPPWHLTLSAILFQAICFLSCWQTNDITLILPVSVMERGVLLLFPFFWTQQILSGLVSGIMWWNPSPRLCAEITVKLFILSSSESKF